MGTQVAQKTTETEIIMNKYINIVAIAVLVVGLGVYYGIMNSIVKQITSKRRRCIPVRCILKLFRTNLENARLRNDFD
jgi:hypothetical protein